MILDKILNECVWDDYGVKCANANEALVIHKFLREAILDKHMYIGKVIGYEVRSGNSIRTITTTYIARHVQIGESYPELMINLSDKVFLCSNSGKVSTKVSTGLNKISNVQFLDDKKNLVNVLYEKEDICTVLKDYCTLDLVVSYDCGYNSMSSNSKVLDKNYFPCYTDFSVSEYFRVLPPEFGSDKVLIRYYNKATKEILQYMLIQWRNAVANKSVRKEELTWLLSFEQ